MVDTRSISYDKRWAWISLGLAYSLQRLCIVCTHSYLSNINVTISSLHQTKIFLCYSLSASCELSNGTKWCCFRWLSTCIWINLSIQYQNVDIFSWSQNMIKASVANVIRCTISTYNPLWTLNEVVIQCLQLLADWATLLCTSSDNRLQLCCSFLRTLRIIFVGYPLVSGSYKLSRNTLLGLTLFEQVNDTLFHLLVT